VHLLSEEKHQNGEEKKNAHHCRNNVPMLDPRKIEDRSSFEISKDHIGNVGLSFFEIYIILCMELVGKDIQSHDNKSTEK
jgi:hypothetical protein